jgi:hypothetical protein
MPANLKAADRQKMALAQLELELIQTHMTEEPYLWIEVGAHAVRKRS